MERAIRYQTHGMWDSIRARDYWRNRLPQMDLSVLADVLAIAYPTITDRQHKSYEGKESRQTLNCKQIESSQNPHSEKGMCDEKNAHAALTASERLMIANAMAGACISTCREIGRHINSKDYDQIATSIRELFLARN